MQRRNDKFQSQHQGELPTFRECTMGQIFVFCLGCPSEYFPSLNNDKNTALGFEGVFW